MLPCVWLLPKCTYSVDCRESKVKRNTFATLIAHNNGGSSEFVPIKGLNVIMVADKRLMNLSNIVKM